MNMNFTNLTYFRILREVKGKLNTGYVDSHLEAAPAIDIRCNKYNLEFQYLFVKLMPHISTPFENRANELLNQFLLD